MLPERRLISRLHSRFGSRARDVALGIGDDCAILRVHRGEEVLVTTDFSLEGVHFRRDWQSAECIGHRCLARGLSDIAAMGGRPVAAFLSLALPSGLSLKWVDKFFTGLRTLARKNRVELAGGDTAQCAAGVLADIAIVGSVTRGKALLRSGARVDDQIYVTGYLGESAAALQLLTTGKIRKRDVFPNPRLAVGEWLRTHRSASSAIDISDGLSMDLAHICEESGMGALIEAEPIPIHPKARLLDNAIELALHGGEDYELLFTAPRSRRMPLHIAGVKITRIGEIVRGKDLEIVRNGNVERLLPRGWEHFRKAGEERTRSTPWHKPRSRNR